MFQRHISTIKMEYLKHETWTTHLITQSLERFNYITDFILYSAIFICHESPFIGYELEQKL